MCAFVTEQHCLLYECNDMPIQSSLALQSHVIDIPANPPDSTHPVLALHLACNQPGSRATDERLTAYRTGLLSTLDGPTLRCTVVSLAILLGAGALMGLGIAGLANAGPMHIRRVCGVAPEASATAASASDPTSDCQVSQRIKEACVGTLFGATILAIVGATGLGGIISDIRYRMRHGNHHSGPRNIDYNSGLGGGGGVGDGGGSGA